MKYQIVTDDHVVLIESENEEAVAAWVLNNCYRNREGWFFEDKQIHRVMTR